MDISENKLKIAEDKRHIWIWSVLTEDETCDAVSRGHIGMAENAFKKIRRVLRDRQISLETEKKVFKCYVIYDILYLTDENVARFLLTYRYFARQCLDEIHPLVPLALTFTDITQHALYTGSNHPHRIPLVRRKFYSVTLFPWTAVSWNAQLTSWHELMQTMYLLSKHIFKTGESIIATQRDLCDQFMLCRNDTCLDKNTAMGWQFQGRSFSV